MLFNPFKLGSKLNDIENNASLPTLKTIEPALKSNLLGHYDNVIPKFPARGRCPGWQILY